MLLTTPIISETPLNWKKDHIHWIVVGIPVTENSSTVKTRRSVIFGIIGRGEAKARLCHLYISLETR
jgi:hypothetical protein